MRLRLKLFFARLWSSRTAIIALAALALAIVAAVGLIKEQKEDAAAIIPREVVVCFASADMRVGEVLYRDAAPIECRSYSVILSEEMAGTIAPTRKEDLPDVFVPAVNIPSGAIISAHDFVRLYPVHLPLLLTSGTAGVDANGRFAIYFPVPEETPVELLRGYTGARTMVVEGYCYAMVNGACLFLVEKFSLRDDAENVLVLVEGDSYSFIGLLSYITGWKVWRYDYPFYPPVLGERE